MTGGLFGSDATRNPCCASVNESRDLHCASAIPVGVSCCHVAAPSTVCQSDTACDWHCVPGDDTELIQPSRSLTNAISAFATAPVGKKRRSHVAPRSLERNSAL